MSTLVVCELTEHAGLDRAAPARLGHRRGVTGAETALTHRALPFRYSARAVPPRRNSHHLCPGSSRRECENREPSDIPSSSPARPAVLYTVLERALGLAVTETNRPLVALPLGDTVHMQLPLYHWPFEVDRARGGATADRLTGKRSARSSWRLLDHKSESAAALAGRHKSTGRQAPSRAPSRRRRHTRVHAKVQPRADRHPRLESR